MTHLYIVVKGAHYEATERPVGGVGTCHTVSGWAAPAGGIHAEHAIEMVTQEQNVTEGKLNFITARVRSTTGGYVFTGVCLSTGGGG